MRPNRRVLAGCLLSLCGMSHAAEFTAEADVVSAEPILRFQTSIHRTAECTAKPAPGASLTALLEWDLVVGACRQQERHERVDGYRVTYRWNGRLYEQTLREDPGATVPVSVRIH